MEQHKQTQNCTISTIVDFYEKNIINQHCQLDKHLQNFFCITVITTATGTPPENLASTLRFAWINN